MAKPRIFVSSTYYDLKHIRSSLEFFIKDMGYEPILSENGSIAYSSADPLDESCYKEATLADMFILIVGGRYGSEISKTRGGDTDASFYTKYDSVTKKEFDTAANANIPIYILVQSEVYSEYITYCKNEDNSSVNYAHVDSVNVFGFLKHIMSQRKNNPLFIFDKTAQIESWLKEQWAGLFRDYLRDKVESKQLDNMSNQILELKAINDTIKTYLESVINSVSESKLESKKIIENEDKKLSEERNNIKFRQNQLYKHMSKSNISLDEFINFIKSSHTKNDAINYLSDKSNFSNLTGDTFNIDKLRDMISSGDHVIIKDINNARSLLGVNKIAS
ncbi:TPA: DUF4062 domain-containing protein [Yersinia enterocolitica]|nr:DUF4062 domain-containing protein [Yersinia enterocolitica]